MKYTYDKAMAAVYYDEGGYTNESTDPGGPTNWGITLADARMYWKSTATASDVRAMPKSVAAEIYRKHYADPIRYDDLPAGVDYAILDYGINSGISRAIKVAQAIAGVPRDGKMGPQTVEAIKSMDPKEFINKIYDERLAFLQGLSHWPTYGRGWTARCTRGRKLALELTTMKPTSSAVGPIVGSVVVASGAAATHQYPHLWPWIVFGTLAVLGIAWITFNVIREKYVSKT